MTSDSMLYNLMLLPLVCFGAASVMMAFVVMLPGVGQALAALWTVFVGDHFFQKMKGGSSSDYSS